MKKGLFVLSFLLCTLSLSAQQKIGYLNSDSVLLKMPEYQKVLQDVQAMEKKYNDELTGLRNEFNQRFQRFIDERAGLDQIILERRMREIQDNEKKIVEFKQAAQDNLKESYNKGKAPALERLQQAVSEAAVAEGVDLVIDTATSSLLYIGPNVVDLTSATLKLLNAK